MGSMAENRKAQKQILSGTLKNVEMVISKNIWYEKNKPRYKILGLTKIFLKLLHHICTNDNIWNACSHSCKVCTIIQCIIYVLNSKYSDM